MLRVRSFTIIACISPYSAICNKEYRINWVSLLNNVALLIVEHWLEWVADVKQKLLMLSQVILFYDIELRKKNKFVELQIFLLTKKEKEKKKGEREMVKLKLP